VKIVINNLKQEIKMDDLELFRQSVQGRLNKAIMPSQSVTPVEETEVMNEESAGENLGQAFGQIFGAIAKKAGNEEALKDVEKVGTDLGKAFSDAANKALQGNAEEAAKGLMDTINNLVKEVQGGVEDIVNKAPDQENGEDEQLNMSRYSHLEEGGELQVGAAQGLLGAVSQEKVAEFIKNMSPEEYQKFTDGLQSDAIDVLFQAGKETPSDGGGEEEPLEGGDEGGSTGAKLDDLGSQIQSGL
jgi:hypothetical protein